MATQNDLFSVDQFDSTLPGAISAVPSNDPIILHLTVPTAGGFATTGNISSNLPANINIYVKQAPATPAVSQGSNTITLACSAPVVSGSLHVYTISCANSSSSELVLSAVPTLASVAGASIVGSSANPVVISPGAVGSYSILITSSSTEAISLQVSLGQALAPIFF